jgi:hypothetical protein
LFGAELDFEMEEEEAACAYDPYPEPVLVEGEPGGSGADEALEHQRRHRPPERRGVFRHAGVLVVDVDEVIALHRQSLVGKISFVAH